MNKNNHQAKIRVLRELNQTPEALAKKLLSAWLKENLRVVQHMEHAIKNDVTCGKEVKEPFNQAVDALNAIAHFVNTTNVDLYRGGKFKI